MNTLHAYHENPPLLKATDAFSPGGALLRLSVAGPREAPEQYRLPIQPAFNLSERSCVTILFGGLTRAHERLFKALLESRGFRVDVLPTPALEDYHTGRRYANNGFCNPIYFTGGSLVNYLRAAEARGLSREEVCSRYVYLTSRSSGPCRLGLYEQEYRSILCNAGYTGFRVFAFSDTFSLRAGKIDEGFPFDMRFYTDLISALMLGDILNDLANRTRPYESIPGSTDRVWEQSIAFAENCLRVRPRASGRITRLLPSRLRSPLESLGRVFTWPMDARLLRVVLYVRRRFRTVHIDPFRVRPAVKLIGEFWAQTTQGDGNFQAHRFFERHGAEVVVEPVTVWALYLLFEADQKLRQAMMQLRHNRSAGLAAGLRYAARILMLKSKACVLRLGEMSARLKYNTIRLAFRSVPDPLPSVRAFEKFAHGFYNPSLAGGESFMEVGKTLYYTQNKRAHLIVSLKPFGCMPSGMSDGVQPLALAHHPQTLFLSIETSSEGRTNAQSRMLMVLSTARERAQREYDDALASARKRGSGISERFTRHRRGAHALTRCRVRGLYACRAARELRAISPREPFAKR